MQVLKFGGTSMANAESFNAVADIVQLANKEKDKVLIVLSALSGTTDLLIECAQLASVGDISYKELLEKNELRHLELVKQLIPLSDQSRVLTQVKKSCNKLEDICNGIYLLKELSSRTKDLVASFGESMSTAIFDSKLRSLGLRSVCKSSFELILTDSNFGCANVLFPETNNLIREYFKDYTESFCVIPGFIAKDIYGNITTLGRGGSDYTAAILAAALNVERLEIWTDVSGMMSADPKLVNNAREIPEITYQEAMELSHFGAKVIYPPTLLPVMNQNIPVLIKNTFSPGDAGTLIHENAITGNKIVGISSINKIALISLEGSGMIGIPGFSKRLFESLSDNRINVILITQASSEHSICVVIDEVAANFAKEIIDETFFSEIKAGALQAAIIEKDHAILALVGDKMKNHPGISGKMFHVLGRNGINVRAIAQGSSERNISAVIAKDDIRKAINVLHEEFFETSYKQVNLFICGTGNVGKKLITQLIKQSDHLLKDMRLQIKIAGIANSRKMFMNDNGWDIHTWEEHLQNGQETNIQSFANAIISKNLRNAVFVDVTASAVVADVYKLLLKKSVSVVACNKIACSSVFENYQELKNLAREFNALLLFETNVGAGLPVIGTLSDLIRSGDKVVSIQAVLSGTLNFVFNNYDGKKSFASVVRQAQAEGFTEPDPRLDLGGTDVMRKIMILGRESGYKIEMADISNNSFMPQECMEGSVEDFYRTMEKYEDHFYNLYNNASSADTKLKFVARFEQGRCSVGLENIGKEHDLYHLYGKDNVVLFYTDRYKEQPLVIKGAGAGADVTASGVFADIIRAAAPVN